MSSNFANKESSDSDSSWIDFSNDLRNLSIKPGTSNMKDSHKLDDAVTKKSSEEFEVVDYIEPVLHSRESSVDIEKEVSIYYKKFLENLALKINSEDEETLVPFLLSSANLNDIFKEKSETLGADYKPIPKDVFTPIKEEDPLDQLDNKNSKKSIDYSDDDESWKAPRSNFDEDIDLLAKNRLCEDRAKKSQRWRCSVFFIIVIAFCTMIYKLKQAEPELKDSPTEITSTPVKISHEGWNALTEEFKPVLGIFDDYFDLDDDDECPSDFQEMEMKKMKGISFTMLRNHMIISIGVDETKTYVIYEKNGTINVKMIPETLTDNTLLFFTSQKKIKTEEFIKWCPVFRAVKIITGLWDAVMMAISFFIQIILKVVIVFLWLLIWCVDFYRDYVCKVLGWE